MEPRVRYEEHPTIWGTVVYAIDLKTGLVGQGRNKTEADMDLAFKSPPEQEGNDEKDTAT